MECDCDSAESSIFVHTYICRTVKHFGPELVPVGIDGGGEGAATVDGFRRGLMVYVRVSMHKSGTAYLIRTILVPV